MCCSGVQRYSGVTYPLGGEKEHFIGGAASKEAEVPLCLACLDVVAVGALVHTRHSNTGLALCAAQNT